jgi:FtsP/CotA-like multicopper oxidase with cupredoxin domain
MRRARFLSILLCAAVLGACSLLGRSTPGETVTLEVDNNLSVPTGVTVYAYSDVGSRQLIGNVLPGRQTVLHFHAGHITGSYRFVAVAAREAQLVSNPISLNGGETVSWELRNNTLLVAQ